MKLLGTVTFRPQKACQGLVVGVGDIVEGIAACAAEEGAGVKAELRVKGADAAVGRCIQICKVDTLLHKTVDRRCKLSQHPVVHGLHQHNNDIFPGQKPCHFIGFLLLLPGKPCMNLLFCFLLSATVARGQGIDPVGIEILGHGLIQSANLIQPMGVKHILIRSLCRLHTAIVGLRIANGIVCFKYGLGKQQSSHSGQNSQKHNQYSGQHSPLPVGELPNQSNTNCQQAQHPEKPFCRIAGQNIQIAGSLRSIPELRKPQHLIKQNAISTLPHGVNQSRPIQQSKNRSCRFPGQKMQSAGQHHCPEKAEGQRPRFSPVPKKTKGKHLRQQKCKQQQPSRQVFSFFLFRLEGAGSHAIFPPRDMILHYSTPGQISHRKNAGI